jgi:hypothetical protein
MSAFIRVEADSLAWTKTAPNFRSGLDSFVTR